MLAWDYSYKRLEVPNKPSWLFNASIGKLVIGSFSAYKSMEYRGFNDPNPTFTKGIAIGRVTSLGRKETATKQPLYLNLQVLQVYPKYLYCGHSHYRYQARDKDSCVRWKLFDEQNTKDLTLEELMLVAEVIGMYKFKVTKSGKFTKIANKA